jgi:hypothetical protein
MVDEDPMRFLPLAIQHGFDNDAVQMAAVQQDGRAILYIENPSEAVQMAAVQQNGGAIQFIKNPSEAVQMAAVRQDGMAIWLIKKPSEAVQMAAVQQNSGQLNTSITRPKLCRWSPCSDTA